MFWPPVLVNGFVCMLPAVSLVPHGAIVQTGRHALGRLGRHALLFCLELGAILYRVTLLMTVVALLVKKCGTHYNPARPILDKVGGVFFRRLAGRLAYRTERHIIAVVGCLRQ